LPKPRGTDVGVDFPARHGVENMLQLFAPLDSIDRALEGKITKPFEEAMARASGAAQRERIACAKVHVVRDHGIT
jgi:hypothetical protein